eukprot:12426998-Karenia_brevis.AAC.1
MFASVIAACDPGSGEAKLFTSNTLSFGQTAAVYGFLRFSRAISALARTIFGVSTVEFFDDFTQLEPRATAESAQFALESMLDLLGWAISTGEDKRKPFGLIFDSLGARVDFSTFRLRSFKVTNKRGR